MLPSIAELPTQGYAHRDDADGREEHGDPRRSPRTRFSNQNGEDSNRQCPNSHNWETLKHRPANWKRRNGRPAAPFR
jgi:hypothetical protein